MLKRLIQRTRDEEGFTLIELMVVVLIIGILIAIALPTFLGARTRAQDKAAQSDLRNALVAAKTMYTDSSSYAAANETATGLETVEPSLDYVSAATVSVSTPTPTVSVSAAAANWAASRSSASGKCFSIRDTASGTTYGQAATSAACTGTAAATVTATAWT